MDDILEILGKVFGLDPDDTLGSLIERGKKIHSRLLTRSILFLIPLVLVEYALNVTGLKGANLALSLLLGVATLLVSTRAEIVLSVLGIGALSGAIKTPETVASEIKDFLNKYLDIIGTVLLWMSVASLFLGTLPFENNPAAILLMLSSLLVVKLGAWKWEFGLTLYKHVIYYYALVCFLYSVYSIFPAGSIPGTGKNGIISSFFNFLGVKSRQEAQTKRTWQIPENTLVFGLYDPFEKKELGTRPYSKGSKMIEVVSLGENQDNNGVSYDKVSLPDEATGTPGRYTGWVQTAYLKPVAPEKKGDKSVTLIDTVRIDQPPFAREIPGHLPPGEYTVKFEPAEAAAGAELQLKLPDGKHELRKIENNRVSVKKGEKGYAVKALSVAIARIYI